MGIFSFLFKSPKEKERIEMDKIRDQMFNYVEAGDIHNLMKGLKSKHWFSRYCAAGGLMDLGNRSLIAVPDLLTVFQNDPHADVQWQAGRALLTCGPLALAPIMRVASQKRLQPKFIMLTELVIPMGREGVPFLVELLKTDAENLHYYCHCSLEQITGLKFENSSQWVEWHEQHFSDWYDQQSGKDVKEPGLIP
jgi:hypothetical protein